MRSVVVALLVSAFRSPIAQAPLVASVDSATARTNNVSFRITNVTGVDFEEPLHVQMRLSFIRKAGEAMPMDELWAPFDPQSGTPYKANNPPMVHVRAGEAIERAVDPHALKWSPTIQSVWPDRPLDALITTGQYRLWLDMEFRAGTKPTHFETNKVIIEFRR